MKLIIRTVFIFIVLSVSALAAAQIASPPPEVAADNVKKDRYPVHDVTFLNGGKSI